MIPGQTVFIPVLISNKVVSTTIRPTSFLGKSLR